MTVQSGSYLIAMLATVWVADAVRGSDPEPNYIAAVEEWKVQRVNRLTSDTGWLTIAGFHWLKPGANSFGAGADNDMVIPAGPARAGVLHLEQGEGGVRIEIEPESGVEIRLDDTVLESRTLLYEDGGDRSVVAVDRITFWIIPRGGRYAVRLRDPESPRRRNFTQIDYYPIDQRYRVVGQLEPKPRKVLVPNIMGYEDSVLTPGPVTFTIPDGTFQLYPLQENPADSTELFFILEDKTSGIETYGGGRYFYSVLEPDGKVVLDFNRFYNPPCVFTPFATCGLPPDENRLSVAIRAGEKQYTGPTY